MYDSGTLTVNLGDPNADASAVGKISIDGTNFLTVGGDVSFTAAAGNDPAKVIVTGLSWSADTTITYDDDSDLGSAGDQQTLDVTVSVSDGTTTDDPAPSSGRPIFDLAAGALVDDDGADIAAGLYAFDEQDGTIIAVTGDASAGFEESGSPITLGSGQETAVETITAGTALGYLASFIGEVILVILDLL